MTTTLQQIQDRAIGHSSANGLTSLVQSTSEIINQIANYEIDLYDLAAKVNRYFFAAKVAVASTGGSSERSIDLASLTLPCYRLLQFKLNDGRIVNQVDGLDTEGELAPRYYLLGKVIYEVGSDWSPSSGAVSGKLVYMKGPAALNVAGDLTQTLSIDDDLTDGIELHLARYLAHKDVGRGEQELKDLDAMIAESEQGFVDHITEFGGVEARRFTQPTKGDKS